MTALLNDEFEQLKRFANIRGLSPENQVSESHDAMRKIHDLLETPIKMRPDYLDAYSNLTEKLLAYAERPTPSSIGKIKDEIDKYERATMS
jgi:hypothetical protein